MALFALEVKFFYACNLVFNLSFFVAAKNTCRQGRDDQGKKKKKQKKG
jgi:hypothetical protein